MKAKAIIIDDEKNARELLKSLLNKECRNIDIVATCNNIEQSELLINQFRPDVVFLDVQLNQESGFDLFKKIPHPDFETIFVTAYDHYAIKAIEYSALDYLLKPLNPDHVKRAGERIAKKRNIQIRQNHIEILLKNIGGNPEKMNRIALPVTSGLVMCNLDEIIYCEADEKYSLVNLICGEEHIVNKGISELSELLPESFFRVHRSYLVNLNRVKQYNKDKDEITLDTGLKLPVSDRNKKRLAENLKKF
jgi:two-component system LytT family response regulator